MRIKLLKAFWGCGDNEIIEYAILRARLNRIEKEVLTMLFDECYTQEETAEELEISTRTTQYIWYKAADKLLNIPWVRAYAEELLKGN